MENQHLLALLRSRIGTLVIWGFVFGTFSFFGLLLIEKPVQTKMDFLVVQSNVTNQDFYSLFKSSEYLGKVLSEAVHSERFIDALVETGKVNGEFLPFDKQERLSTWRKTVQVEKNLELGILSVTVVGERERDVARIMEGVAQVLTEKNMLFRGGDEKSVEIRVLSGPILEKNPNTSKIVKVALAAFLAGFFAGAFYLLVQYESRYRPYPRNDQVPLNDRMA